MFIARRNYRVLELSLKFGIMISSSNWVISQSSLRIHDFFWLIPIFFGSLSSEARPCSGEAPWVKEGVTSLMPEETVARHEVCILYNIIYYTSSICNYMVYTYLEQIYTYIVVVCCSYSYSYNML
jgi:hypothetical protein